MTEYNYSEHHVDSFLSARTLAEELKISGEYDLFRGQKHTFPIQPTINRPEVDRHTATSELNDFASWVHETPDLSSLHGNQNAILAVAQHFGLKTPLLDFSRSPRIAGFFATDGAKAGDTGTIICLNKKRFIESWSDINNKYYKDKGELLTEIIKIKVNNLWRLHAQEGEFLKCKVDPSILEMFSCFMHIYFPQNCNDSEIPQEDIYPCEKSHLEVLLDQYFLIKSYPERGRLLHENFEKNFTIKEEEIKNTIEGFFKNNQLPNKHVSWETSLAKQWMKEPTEHYGHHTVHEITLILPCINNQCEFEEFIEKQLHRDFVNIETNNRPSFKWGVTDEKGNILYVDQEGITKNGEGEFTNFAISEMVSSIYQGMRYLPYQNDEIVRVIVRYFLMLSFGISKVIDNCEGVELLGGYIRGRGSVSGDRVLEALRDDFFDLIKESKLNKNSELSYRETLSLASFVKTSYKFNKFITLFVEDLIPSQAVIAIEGLVIGVNPMRVDIFGEN